MQDRSAPVPFARAFRAFSWLSIVEGRINLHRLRALFASFAAFAVLVALGGCGGADSADKRPASQEAAAPAEAPSDPAAVAVAPVETPPLSVVDLDAVEWLSNDDAPPIGDPKAIRGGTLLDDLGAYPLTFRLMGPNSNDAFAGYNRSYTMAFSLVWRHPNTDEIIPCMATHWYVADDNRTVLFKLDPDARWSDGRPITADDYVFCYEMMQSPHIVDPFYNNYIDIYFESVEKIDDYTLKIVGKRPSWRPLEDYSLFPMPRHAVRLGPNWVREANNTFQVAAGPYVVTEAVAGERVVFERVRNWWGDGKRRFAGMYNVARIHLRVIPDSDRAFDHFKRGELSMLPVGMARRWENEMDFEAVRKGWVRKKRVFVEYPQGVYGIAMNLEFSLFQNKDFRKALQHLFDFDTLNRELMFNAYYRSSSVFEGTEYANPDLAPYPFDPRKAREHLQKAGFMQRGRDGILGDGRGTRAAFTFTYGSKTLEPHLTVIREMYRRAGIDMKLNLLEPATAFERGLERKYEMTLISRTSGLYPEPHQYFGSVFKTETNNNNIWGFGTEETDRLIETYRFDFDKEKRLAAMHQLDALLHDEAFYIPFWSAPYIRFAYWDHIRWPETYLPRRTQQITDWQVFWIDPERKKRLDEAMAKGESLGEDTNVDIDPYGIQARFESR